MCQKLIKAFPSEKVATFFHDRSKSNAYFVACLSCKNLEQTGQEKSEIITQLRLFFYIDVLARFLSSLTSKLVRS